MGVKQIRGMPPSGATAAYPLNPTPRCQSKVQVIGKHAYAWRKREHGDTWEYCIRPSTVEMDDLFLCRRHAGERVLEDYLAGRLIPVAKHPTMPEIADRGCSFHRPADEIEGDMS